MWIVVLESPNKVSKVQKFLQKGFTVIASKGHFRDLHPKHQGILPMVWQLSKGNNFNKTFRDLCLKNKDKLNGVILMTDPDREGEAIAWHISEAIPPTVRKSAGFKVIRATTSEITKNGVCSAVENAIKMNRKIDIPLVHAQWSRRLLDRRIG